MTPGEADGTPPPDSFSFELRIVDRSVPVPEPNLNSIASLVARRMMSSMLSSTDWIKQADAWGYSYGVSGRWIELVSVSQR